MLSADCAAPKEVFAWGIKGQDACPAGYQEITDDATCQRGASQLCTGDKCKFFPMSTSGRHGASQTGTAAKICNWCTGCDDGKPVFVDRGHGSIAYWLCKKEDTEVITGGDCEYGLTPGALGPKDTQLNLCSGESVIDFAASSVVHNNLGGSGPDSGPEHIRYATVATVRGRPVDLLVSTTSPGYTPEFSAANGRQGGMGLISMKSGAKVDLKFQFVESGSNTPTTIDAFTFAFLDFDRWIKGKGGLECLKIYGFDSHEVARGAEVTQGIGLAGGLQYGTFCATAFGSRFDNPTNPMNLTAKQASRAVVFRFSSKSEFSATLSVSAQECGFGRSFMFAGA